MDKWRDSEFWKQITAGLVRKVLAIIGAWLAQKSYVSAESVDGITSATLAYFLAGGILIVVSVLWQYAKTKFNILFQRAASDSKPETPLSVVKTDVLSEHNFISSI